MACSLCLEACSSKLVADLKIMDAAHRYVKADSEWQKAILAGDMGAEELAG